MANSPSTDPDLDRVVAKIRELDPTGERIARVLRRTIYQLYDGQRTGRYAWDQLYKTEKTHGGTLVEINLQREFLFEDGVLLDYLIDGVEVDCKFSQTMGGWMIPPEALGHICVVVWAEDSDYPVWSLGFVRVFPELRNKGNNRDAKATLNSAGRSAIRWIWQRAAMPTNVLLQLPDATVDRIMAHRHGTKRVDELFRQTIGRIVSREIVATVAQQDDYMKRVRANGGSRTSLQPEGIVILGHYESHASIATQLGIPRPAQGELISIRLVPASRRSAHSALIDRRRWRPATPEDESVPGPTLPQVESRERSKPALRPPRRI